MMNTLPHEPTMRVWYVREYRRWHTFYAGYVNRTTLARLATHNRYVREFYATKVRGAAQ